MTTNTERDTVKLTFSLFTNKVGSLSEVSIDSDIEADEWAEMSEAEREDFCKQLFWDAAMDKLGGWDWNES